MSNEKNASTQVNRHSLLIASVRMTYRALVFDLFGTVVHFKPQVPALAIAGTMWHSNLAWLQDQVSRDIPEVPFEEFARALVAVTEEIVLARAPEHLEVPSGDRFHRTLDRLGVAGPNTRAVAERLSLAHMAHLAAQTELPAEHDTLLRRLARRYRLGLVSNFDHAPTARHILARDGVDDVFEVALISAEIGRRKPHPAIFQEALRQLDAEPSESLYIGDNPADDVAGAHAAGMHVVWINTSGTPVGEGIPRPTHTIRRLGELPRVLDE